MRKILTIAVSISALAATAAVAGSTLIARPVYKPTAISFITTGGDEARKIALQSINAVYDKCMKEEVVIERTDRLIDIDKKVDGCLRRRTNNRAYLTPRFGTACGGTDRVQSCTVAPAPVGNVA